MKDKLTKDLELFNNYTKSEGELKLTDYMFYLHPVYPHLPNAEKEKVVVNTLRLFPQTQAYAVLKGISNRLELPENFPDEYKETGYKGFIDDIETELLIGFGDIDVFLTYAKLYCTGVNDAITSQSDKVRNNFFDLRLEKHSWVKMA